MEVTPWPEVEDDNLERQGDTGTGSRAALLSEKSGQALRGDMISVDLLLGPLAGALAVASSVSPRVGVGLAAQEYYWEILSSRGPHLYGRCAFGP
jgi:hypothetical protein